MVGKELSYGTDTPLFIVWHQDVPAGQQITEMSLS